MRRFCGILLLSVLPLLHLSAQIAPKPIDKKATKQVVGLYNYLRNDVWGKKVLSGCQARWDYNTTDADEVSKRTGQYPAVNIFDFQHFRLERVNYLADTAKDWYQSGGIVGFIWHWSVPVDTLMTDSKGYSFYTPSAAKTPQSGTTFSPRRALQQGTPENAVLMRDLKRITSLLLHYQKQGIPIIWRPFHEAAGNTNRGGNAWFWWGSDGASTFKQLYLFMQRYLMSHGVHNLIYVWTSELDDDDWYPGDQFVDIVARDQYHISTNHGSYKEQFDLLSRKYPHKMLALAECDCLPSAEAMMRDGAKWLYVAPWTGPFLFGSNNTPDFWKQFLGSELVVSKSETPYASKAKARVQQVRIQSALKGKKFDGIGAVNGGGATSVLLKDYPEPQRSQILDLVYKPKFGASVSSLLVEIPGDGNSTQGSMPSHSHYLGDFDAQRGYTWWVLREAKSRNPQLDLDATGWSAPRWVGDFWSQHMADYYVDWLTALRQQYGLELNAIGCHNEKGWSNDFAKMLRRTMNERGFKNVKLHAFDNWGANKMDFMKDMERDPELRDAIYAVSAHTFSEIPLTAEQRSMAEKMGKPIWNSEDHVYRKGFDCLISIVKCFNENYIVSGATKVINWYDIGATYPLEPYSQDPPMLIAQQPWSGNYSVRESLWGYAHYGQFTEVGWQYVDDGCLKLDGGGTMCMLRNPATNDYSIIIETKDATAPQTVRISLPKQLSGARLCVWRSNEQEQFVRQADMLPRARSLTLTLDPACVYSLSTTSGQQKGSYAGVPAPASFPIPYVDNYEDYDHLSKWGYLPHYMADIIGCFELRQAPGGMAGTCLQQTVGEHTLSWAPEWHHYSIIGDEAWTDYEVSADVLLNPQDEAAVMGRICDVGSGYGVWAKGYYLKINEHGLCQLYITRGKLDQKELIGNAEQQALILARKDIEVGGEYVLDSAQVQGITAGKWHNLKLRFEGDEITGYVDGKQVVRATSDRYQHGMAGIMAPLQQRRVTTPYFDNLTITPLGRTKAVHNHSRTPKPLY